MFCYDASRGQEIDDSFVFVNYREVSTHLCGTGACPPQFAWRPGSFRPVSNRCIILCTYKSCHHSVLNIQCSVTCGSGVRTCSIECVSTVDHSVVVDIMCIANRRPDATTPCF